MLSSSVELATALVNNVSSWLRLLHNVARLPYSVDSVINTHWFAWIKFTDTCAMSAVVGLRLILLSLLVVHQVVLIVWVRWIQRFLCCWQERVGLPVEQKLIG